MAETPNPIALAIHGGCGTLERSLMAESEWAEAREHLAASLRAGWAVLAEGGGAVGAVEAAVVVMEDSPHFNAGYGAALTEDGGHELDAAIMDGASLAGGAVCGATRIRNPIRAARLVMERTEQVLIAGRAADRLAELHGLDIVDNAHFTTERRRAALASIKARRRTGTAALASEAEKHGTVGAVARDHQGNLAAATSTGGYNDKPAGRVGDSPILGAGTYARNGVCAVSCTGMGEVFIRRAAAYDVTARMMYAGATLAEATGKIIDEIMPAHATGAGLVAVDAAGRVVLPFNTLGMYRGFVRADGMVVVGTHGELHDMGRA